MTFSFPPPLCPFRDSAPSSSEATRASSAVTSQHCAYWLVYKGRTNIQTKAGICVAAHAYAYTRDRGGTRPSSRTWRRLMTRCVKKPCASKPYNITNPL